MNDRFVRISLVVLALTNCAGYLVKNQSETSNLIQALILFSGFMITFIYLQNYRFKRSHAKTILTVVAFISILLFISSVNQKFVFYDTNIPILGAVGTLSPSQINLLYFGRMPSLMGDYELFAEFSLIIFILSFSILMDRKTMKYYKFGIIPYILLVVSLINMLITGTRSGVLLAGLFLVMFSLVRFRAYFTRAGRRIVLITLIIVPTLLIFGEAIGLDMIIDRFKEINLQNVSVESIRSGEELNRSLAYDMGYERLADENWLIGFGYGRDQSNVKAWLGHRANWSDRVRIRDFHSLYLCIPMIYGWIGGFAYLALILYITFLLFMKYLAYQGHPVAGILLGFVFVFIFFLIDQYKINSLRVYYYHFLIWIIMGFALSLVNTKKPASEDSLVHE